MKDSSRGGKAAFITGILLLFSGIIFNEWLLASLFSSDGIISFSKRVIIWLLDISMITAGIVIMKNKSLNIRKAFYLFIVAAIMLFVLEVGLNIINLAIHYGEGKELEDERYLLSPYKDKEWARDLYEEYDDLSGEYKEFRGWGKKEYQGKLVNINSEGVRKTWNPDDFGGKTPKELYVFGPSAIWSFGARDDYTIPSYVSRKLNGKGYDFKVTNYGEWGYAFNQELFYLITLLMKGNRPDYVIFYAWGDVYNAYQSGKPGTLHFSFSIKTRMKELSDIQHIWTGVTNLLKKYSMINKEFLKWNKKFDPPESLFTEAGHNYTDAQLKKLLEDTLGYYSNSYELLDNLSKIYGFKYICFWMPTLFTEEKMTDEETTVEVRLQDEGLTKIYRYANDAYKTNSYPHFYNITDALKDRTETYYLDFGHLSEEGNEVIAERVVSIFEKEYLLNE